jgi:chemotaxis protein CheD
MLPDSTLAPEKAAAQPAMFADTGLPQLFTELHSLHADRGRLRLFVAGGANVLGANSDNFRIGERNLRAVSTWLSQRGYSASFSDVGGTINRTVHLEIGSGTVKLKSPSGNEAYSLAA